MEITVGLSFLSLVKGYDGGSMGLGPIRLSGQIIIEVRPISQEIYPQVI